jgi:hypothetical protein
MTDKEAIDLILEFYREIATDKFRIILDAKFNILLSENKLSEIYDN